LESVISVWPFSRRLANATPLTGSLIFGLPLPYCQTICPARVISMARLLFSSQIDLDDALVGLVGDEHVEVWQPGILHRRIELIGLGAGDAKLAVLPDDVLVAIH
jgi:hypothetical protein